MEITGIDHLVITVSDIQRTVEFYCDILSMNKVVSADGRTSLQCGRQKINLHTAGQEFSPHALNPSPGSADYCLLTETDNAVVMDEVERKGHPVVAGPVERSGACGRLLSMYLRDPDGNLVEIAKSLE